MVERAAPESAVEIVRAVCGLLSGDPVTVGEVAALLGTVIEVLPEAMGLVVAPSAVGWAEATVVPVPGGEAPHVVRLSPAAGVAIAELERELGPSSSVARRHVGDAPRVRWVVDEVGRPYRCSVMAEVAGAAAAEVIVRRDARVE